MQNHNIKSESHFTFPDLSVDWSTPYSDNSDPHAAEILSASADWISGIHSQCATASWAKAFKRCDFSLMTDLCYPFSRGGHLRACAEWFNYTFTYDDYFEKMDVNDMERETEDTLRALENPHLPHSEEDSFLTRLTREFWLNVITHGKPSESSRRRWILSYKEYLYAVIQERRDDQDRHVRTVEEHILLRRGTAGAYPTFVLLCFPDDIPDYIMDHPRVKHLTLTAMDIVGLANDLHSFNVEQSRGQSHNAVSSAMMERKRGFQDAVDHVYDLYRDRVAAFLQGITTVPHFSEAHDHLIAQYFQWIQYWITGYLEWAMRTERYFGSVPKECRSGSFVVDIGTRNEVLLDEWFHATIMHELSPVVAYGC